MKRNLKHGCMVYFSSGSDLCKGIFCGYNLDKSHSIVFQIHPKPIVLETKEHNEFYACTEVWNDDLYTDPKDLIDHLTADYREQWEDQLKAMTKQEARERDL